jgi:hypothetical protein
VVSRPQFTAPERENLVKATKDATDRVYWMPIRRASREEEDDCGLGFVHPPDDDAQVRLSFLQF